MIKRFGEEVVNWVQGWGDSISVNGTTTITPAEIDAMIIEGAAHSAKPEYAERKAEIDRVVENLRLYQINRLDARANDEDISDADRIRARADSNVVLKTTVIANPTLYISTIEDMASEMESLKLAHTSSE